MDYKRSVKKSVNIMNLLEEESYLESIPFKKIKGRFVNMIVESVEETMNEKSDFFKGLEKEQGPQQDPDSGDRAGDIMKRFQKASKKDNVEYFEPFLKAFSDFVEMGDELSVAPSEDSVKEVAEVADVLISDVSIDYKKLLKSMFKVLVSTMPEGKRNKKTLKSDDFKVLNKKIARLRGANQKQVVDKVNMIMGKTLAKIVNQIAGEAKAERSKVQDDMEKELEVPKDAQKIAQDAASAE